MLGCVADKSILNKLTPFTNPSSLTPKAETADTLLVFILTSNKSHALEYISVYSVILLTPRAEMDWIFIFNEKPPITNGSLV